MTDFAHGGDIYAYPDKLLDFSANISPLGLPDSVQSALTASIESWSGYPDPYCQKLKAAIAGHHTIPEAYITCGNGAAELIYKVVQALKPRRALVTAPSFSEYRQALSLMGCGILDYFLDAKDGFCATEKLLTVLNPPLELLILCNPNNPTGQTMEPGLLDKIIKTCAEKKIHILLDECFIPFLDHAEAHTKIPLLSEYPNLLILRAFTKFYAMAGLRLGYLLCSDDALLRKISACGQPWSVSAPAQIAGVAALADTEYADRLRHVIRKERAYLTGALKQLGLCVTGSQANYLFFQYNGMNHLKERLLKDKILIRSCGNYLGLDRDFYRVSVRTHAENQRLIEAIAGIIGEEG